MERGGEGGEEEEGEREPPKFTTVYLIPNDRSSMEETL